jgi:hypothetical protein
MVICVVVSPITVQCQKAGIRCQCGFVLCMSCIASTAIRMCCSHGSRCIVNAIAARSAHMLSTLRSTFPQAADTGQIA